MVQTKLPYRPIGAWNSRWRTWTYFILAGRTLLLWRFIDSYRLFVGWFPRSDTEDFLQPSEAWLVVAALSGQHIQQSRPARVLLFQSVVLLLQLPSCWLSSSAYVDSEARWKEVESDEFRDYVFVVDIVAIPYFHSCRGDCFVSSPVTWGTLGMYDTATVIVCNKHEAVLDKAFTLI